VIPPIPVFFNWFAFSDQVAGESPAKANRQNQASLRLVSRNQIREAGVVVGFVALGAFAACHEERPSAEAPANATPAPSAEIAQGGRPSAVPDAGAGASAGASLDPGSAAVAPTAPTTPASLPIGVARIAAATVPPASLKAVVTANNAFASALFGQVRVGSAGKNLLTSPISATLALSMAYAGATGRTRAEMAQALRFGAHAGSAIFEGQNALSQALLARGPDALASSSRNAGESKQPPAPSDYALQTVNSVWGEASYHWEPPFLNTLGADYGTSVYARDFRHHSDAARLEINGWVSAQTNDKIQNLLPPRAVQDTTRLVLVNALHLKFPWEQAFEPSATSSAPFTRADRKQISVPFMHRQSRVAYLDDGAAQIVALPLSGRQLSVIIALPHTGVSLASYERKLRGDSPALAEPASDSLVALSLPKVSFTSAAFSLTDALRGLGMKEAFDPEHAHFEGMCAKPPPNERLYVGDVLQKATIALQETGVEAAAATAVVMMTAEALHRGPVPVPIPMIVNRPYLIAVVDVPTGAVLMLGQIDDPSDAGGE
jgi:serpin B